MDLNFEQLLAEHNQSFKESEVYSDWMPDDGEYIATILKLVKGTTVKDAVTTAWWRLTGRIEDVQDEKFDGREFSVGYYTSKAYGILKGAARVLSGNAELNDLREAHAVLAASPGSVLRVKIRTSTSKKNGKDYTNCFILEVINTTTEASAEELPLTDDQVEVAPGDNPNIPTEADLPSTPETGAEVEAPVDPAPLEVPAEAPTE